MLGSLIDDFHEQKEHQVLVKSFHIFVSRYPKKAGEIHALRAGQVRRKRQHKGKINVFDRDTGLREDPNSACHAGARKHPSSVLA